VPFFWHQKQNTKQTERKQMKLIRIITGCIIALMVPLLGQNLPEGDMVTNIDPAEFEPMPYQATFDGKQITIEKKDNLLKLGENEYVVAMGTAVQGCGFVQVVNRDTGEERYVDTALFSQANPDFTSMNPKSDQRMVDTRTEILELFTLEKTDQQLLAENRAIEVEVQRLRTQMEALLVESERFRIVAAAYPLE
jgi:hypothetical protein